MHGRHEGEIRAYEEDINRLNQLATLMTKAAHQHKVSVFYKLRVYRPVLINVLWFNWRLTCGGEELGSSELAAMSAQALCVPQC